MHRRVAAVVAVIALVLVGLTACTEGENARSTVVAQEQSTTALNQRELNKALPIPSFNYSLKRDALIQIYKLENEARNTWTIVVANNGTPIWSCPSISYPIAGGTQLTNPMQITGASSIPLAEPNGLYSPATSAGTFVLCVRPNGDVAPVYAEPNVITFPFAVEVRDGKIVEIKTSTTQGGKVDLALAAQAGQATPIPASTPTKP